jgi:imidazolonepropionase-like amidohydrolase
MNRLFFTDARLLGDLGKTKPNATVVVEGARILAVGAGDSSVPQPAPDDKIYPLGGRTLMPGMVSGHAHLSYPNIDLDNFISLDMGKPPTYLAVIATKNAEATLKAGFTAAAGAGSLHQIDRVLKDLIREGIVPGPRLMACGQDIVPTAGGLDMKPSWWNLGLSGLPLIVDGPVEVRKAVRAQAKEGNDFIKIYPEGGHGVPMRGLDMQQDEIDAAVSVAHDKGKLVRAHAITKPAIMACLKAGVDIIDHGDHIDDEVIELLVKQEVFVLPSLYFMAEGDQDRSEQRLTRVGKWMEHAAVTLGRAQAAGVKLVTGDDFGTKLAPHGDNGKELAVYVNRLGLSALDVIGWATTNGSEMMRKGDEFGTITPGKLADLLVVDGDPVADITLLGDPSKLVVVMQDGRFITNQLG